MYEDGGLRHRKNRSSRSLLYLVHLADLHLLPAWMVGQDPTCATALVVHLFQLLSDILIAAATRALAQEGVWRSSEMSGPAIVPLCT